MLFDTAFDDEVTVIQVREELSVAFEPPALPFPLVSKKDDEAGEDDDISFRALASGFL